jgi:hypothetical protein
MHCVDGSRDRRPMLGGRPHPVHRARQVAFDHLLGWPFCNFITYTADISVTMNHYVRAVTPAKRRAQRGIMGLLDPNRPTKVARRLQMLEKDGGRYRIRTYTFHRVKT